MPVLWNVWLKNFPPTCILVAAEIVPQQKLALQNYILLQKLKWCGLLYCKILSVFTISLLIQLIRKLRTMSMYYMIELWPFNHSQVSNLSKNSTVAHETTWHKKCTYTYMLDTANHATYHHLWYKSAINIPLHVCHLSLPVYSEDPPYVHFSIRPASQVMTNGQLSTVLADTNTIRSIFSCMHSVLDSATARLVLRCTSLFNDCSTDVFYGHWFSIIFSKFSNNCSLLSSHRSVLRMFEHAFFIIWHLMTLHTHLIIFFSHSNY